MRQVHLFIQETCNDARGLTIAGFPSQGDNCRISFLRKQKIYDTFDKAINVFTLSELAGEGDVEVPDPYGKGVEEYNKCFEQLYSYVEKVVKVISAPKNEAD